MDKKESIKVLITIMVFAVLMASIGLETSFRIEAERNINIELSNEIDANATEIMAYEKLIEQEQFKRVANLRLIQTAIMEGKWNE